MKTARIIGQKGEQKEVRLTLDVDAADLLLRLAGSPRKQGEYVSSLIRMAAKQTNLAELEEIEEPNSAATRTLVHRVRRDLTARINALEQELTELKTTRQQG